MDKVCFSLPSASDKPDLGLEELQKLNVKERFQVFEHYQTETTQESDRGPVNPVPKKSPSILSKLAKWVTIIPCFHSFNYENFLLTAKN